MNGKKYASAKRKRLINNTVVHVILAILAVIWVFPILWVILTSFRAEKGSYVSTFFPQSYTLDNYIKLFTNSKLGPAILQTFLFCLIVVVAQFILGMALALVLNSNIKCARFFRSIMMTPWCVPTVISALIWMWIFQPQYGLMRYIVSVVTFGQVTDLAMLNSPSTALLGIAIAALWKQVPLSTLLLLAGLQNVPGEIQEAATMDGASARVCFFRITLPYMKSVIKVVLSMAIIENFKQFPLIWTMTGGGPNNATTTLAVLSYREAFVSNNLGSGAAVTTVWMLLMIVVVVVYNKFMGDNETT